MCPILLCSFFVAISLPPALPAGQPVSDFQLLDSRGRPYRLSDLQANPVIVIAFLGADCPLAQLYAPRLNEVARRYQSAGVAVIGINANEQDGITRIEQYVRRHHLVFPVLKDVGNIIADRLAAERTPEVFVLDHTRHIRYRGRIDDQYDVGAPHSQARHHYLLDAIEDVLAHRPVRVPLTPARGCRIGRIAPPASAGALTYYKDVAPIVQQRCVRCHHPGGVAPFALTTYRAASGWSEMIREVVEEGRMPPWHANPAYGKFANDTRLSDDERQRLFSWINQGTPAGNPADAPPPPVFDDDWRIGQPDEVISMPRPFQVPAHGTIDYQYFEVDPGFTEDKWIQAAEVRPGNRAVVHHCLIYLRPPGTTDLVQHGPLGSVWLTGVVAGSPPLILPRGMAKRVSAGWKLVFQMHYATNGTPQTDQTRVGLIFANPRTVRREVATNMAINFDIKIPPRTANHREEAWYAVPDKVLLLSLSPHMHLRGKSFRYEANYPDGSREILLDVPRYDYNWQNTYELAEPKLLPAGTRIHCTAIFDNSSANPANPDPNAEVRWGVQSWDEMMIGYLDIALGDQDLTRASVWAALLLHVTRPVVAAPLLATGVLFLLYRRFRKPQSRTIGANSLNPTAT